MNDLQKLFVMLMPVIEFVVKNDFITKYPGIHNKVAQLSDMVENKLNKEAANA